MTTQLADSHINEEEAHFLKRDPWQAWTPTVTQGVAITVTVSYAKFVVLGDTVILSAEILCTSAGTAANNIIIGGIPTAIQIGRVSSTFTPGAGLYFDSGNQTFPGVIVVMSATTLAIRAPTGGIFGVLPAITVANGDIISFTITYER